MPIQLLKKLICGLAMLVVCSGGAALSLEAAELLLHYQQESRRIFYTDPAVRMHVARFDLPAPAIVSRLRITLTGQQSTAAARLHLFGYEGGINIPVLGHELIEPILVQKSERGLQELLIHLPRPLHVDNNQLFVGIDQLAPGVSLVSDSEVREAACVSGRDEKYFYQYLQHRDGSWQYGVFAYAIGLELEYTGEADARKLRDITQTAGLPDSLSFASVSCADIDGDLWQDLLVGGRLFRNRNGRAFSEITGTAGLSGAADASLFIDMNNDGAVDILLFSALDETAAGTRLFVNDGQGVFRLRQEEQGVAQLPPPSSYSIADVNNDSYPDIFVAPKPGTASSTLPYGLYLNDGEYGFVLRNDMLPAAVPASYALAWVDFDADGDADLSIRAASGGGDMLWQNERGRHFVKLENNPASGSASAAALLAGTGCDWADFDNDGDFDLFAPFLVDAASLASGNAIPAYIVANDRRVLGGHLAAAGPRLEFEQRIAGGAWGDVNNDSYQDLFVATSDPCHYAEIYLQNPDHSFSLASYDYGMQRQAYSGDGIWFDFNNDGCLDLLCNRDGALRLLQNECRDAGNYAAIDLKARAGQRRAVGATVTLHTGAVQITRHVRSGRAALMQDPFRLHCGLGGATHIDSLVVRWPGSAPESEVFDDISINTHNLIEQGTGRRGAFKTSLEATATPNPFSDRVRLSFRLSESADVDLTIYTLMGRELRRLRLKTAAAGLHNLEWNAIDQNGLRVPPGVYMYRLSSRVGEAQGTITLIDR